jgi:hypothetical protein
MIANARGNDRAAWITPLGQRVANAVIDPRLSEQRPSRNQAMWVLDTAIRHVCLSVLNIVDIPPLRIALLLRPALMCRDQRSRHPLLVALNIATSARCLLPRRRPRDSTVTCAPGAPDRRP